MAEKEPVYISDKTDVADNYVNLLAQSAKAATEQILETLKEYDSPVKSFKVNVEPATKYNRETKQSEVITRKDGTPVYDIKATAYFGNTQSLNLVFKENQTNASVELSNVVGCNKTKDPKTFKDKYFNISALNIAENKFLSSELKDAAQIVIENHLDTLELYADKLNHDPNMKAIYNPETAKFGSTISIVGTNEDNLAYRVQLSLYKVPADAEKNAGKIVPTVSVQALGEKAEGDVKYPNKGETIAIKREEDFLAIQEALPIQLQEAIVDFKGAKWECADMVHEDYKKTLEAAKPKDKGMTK